MAIFCFFFVFHNCVYFLRHLEVLFHIHINTGWSKVDFSPILWDTFECINVFDYSKNVPYSHQVKMPEFSVW